MPVIQIRDLDKQRHVLSVDLRDVLDVLGKRCARAMWEVDGVAEYEEGLMATGGAEADQLEMLARSGQRVSGAALAKLAREVCQVIWGEFRAYEGSAETPWVTIRAIDSHWYEVRTDDAEVISKIRSAFRDVRSVT